MEHEEALREARGYIELTYPRFYKRVDGHEKWQLTKMWAGIIAEVEDAKARRAEAAKREAKVVQRRQGKKRSEG